IIPQPKNGRSKPLGPNNSYKVFSNNAPKPTKPGRVIDPPSSLMVDSEEERLETSNAIITIKEEDSKITIVPRVIKTNLTKHDPTILSTILPMLQGV